MTTSTWTITGMTCDHCANAIVEEVSELVGVDSVSVDRSAATMTLSTTAEISDSAVSEAVAEAGNYAARKQS